MVAEAIEEAATRMNEPADLINIALERLVEGSVVAGRADDQTVKIKQARNNLFVLASVVCKWRHTHGK